MSDLVHWSDWSSQPTVRIACTQKGGFPWKIRKDLPDQVHEIPEGEVSTLYTFQHHLVTCPHCLAMESFQRECAARVEVLTKAGWTFPPEHPEGVPPVRDHEVGR